MPEQKKEGAEKEKQETVKTPVPPKNVEKKPEKQPEPKAPPAPKKPEPLVSFARWFRSKRFKPHWAAGMEAYTDTTRRRSMADWDRLFKNY
jgi:hypothetical protein